jgi:hypothetical protein
MSRHADRRAFAATLRIADEVIDRRASDGFVARLTAAGAWRLCASAAPARTRPGVAVEVTGSRRGRFDRADLSRSRCHGSRSPRADGSCRLDGHGAPAGPDVGGGDDAVAGVAIDARGRIAVAATARDSRRIGATGADRDRHRRRAGRGGPRRHGAVRGADRRPD